MTVLVDSAHMTIRKSYIDPNKFVASNWKPFARRDTRIWNELYLANKSCPVMTEKQTFRRS